MLRKFYARIRQAFTGSPRGMLDRVFQSASGDPPERGTRELLEAYETTPWLRALGEKVGNAIAAQPCHIMAVRRGGKYIRDVSLQRAPFEARESTLKAMLASGSAEEITEHPFLDALEDPNPFMGRLGLMKITEVHLDFVGDAYWLMQRNGLNKPSGYWPIPPHWVLEQPTPTRGTFRVGYRGWNDYIPESEIVWFHEAAPAHPYTRGSGIGWALSDEVQVDEYAAKMASAFFFNRARADFVFATGAGDTETKILERKWNERLQGFQRWFRPFFMAGEVEDIRKHIFEFQHPTMEQLVYPNLRKVERDIILQVWGVAPELFGIVENSNRATIEAAEYLFARWVVAPKLERIRGVLQRHFVTEFDERGVVHYDSAVPADKEHMLAIAKAAPHTRMMDEWRRMQGLEPLGGEAGRAFLVPLNSYLTTDPLDQTTRPQSGGGRPPNEQPEAATDRDMDWLGKALEAVAQRRPDIHLTNIQPQPIALNVTSPAVTVQPAEVPVRVHNHNHVTALPPDVKVENIIPEPRPWDSEATRDDQGRLSGVRHIPAQG